MPVFKGSEKNTKEVKKRGPKLLNIQLNYRSFYHLANQIKKNKQHSTASNRIQYRPLKKTVIRTFWGSAKGNLSENLLCL